MNRCANCVSGQDGCMESCVDCECARCINYVDMTECCLGSMGSHYEPIMEDEEVSDD